MPTKTSSGFYYPTDLTTWTGDDGGTTGDPKQPWDDASSGGRIYGFLDPAAPAKIKTNHVGIDIRQAFNSPIYAISDGTIFSYVTSDGPRYDCIIVRHREATGSFFYAVYGHCRIKNGLTVGSTVEAGEVIGYVNENINQHLHFGIKIDSNFDTGWGHIDLDIDAAKSGWQPPRTWLLTHQPYTSPVDKALATPVQPK